jgi:hypothetical protein
VPAPAAKTRRRGVGQEANRNNRLVLQLPPFYAGFDFAAGRLLLQFQVDALIRVLRDQRADLRGRLA